MNTLIKNLYDKLESWGIDPNTLAKAVFIFLLLLTLVGLMAAFPILLVIVLITIVCVLLIGLIYTMIE
jgi:hypothetical protein